MIQSWFAALFSVVRSRRDLLIENALLRHQLIVLKRTTPRVRFSLWDRMIFVFGLKSLRNWKQVIRIVDPKTVISWHRKGFRLYWKTKSHSTPGRPSVPRDVQSLIREMSEDNPLWGSPRIQAELLKIGIRVAVSTVDKYRSKSPKAPSQSWKTFLKNHANEIVALDLFVVPSIHFKVLYGLVVLSHD